MLTTMVMGVPLPDLMLPTMAVPTITVIPNLSMALVTMRENIQRIEKRKEKRGVIRIRTEIEIGGEARTKIGKGTEIGIGTEIEKEKGLETGIMIVIIGTAAGIAREVSGGEIRTMTMMITTVSGTLIGISASLGLV